MLMLAESLHEMLLNSLKCQQKHNRQCEAPKTNMNCTLVWLPWGLIKTNWFICRIVCIVATTPQSEIESFQRKLCVFQSQARQSFINPDTEIRGQGQANKAVGLVRIGLCCPQGAVQLIPWIPALPSSVQKSTHQKPAPIYISWTCDCLCFLIYGEFLFWLFDWISYSIRYRGVCVCVPGRTLYVVQLIVITPQGSSPPSEIFASIKKLRLICSLSKSHSMPIIITCAVLCVWYECEYVRAWFAQTPLLLLW